MGKKYRKLQYMVLIGHEDQLHLLPYRPPPHRQHKTSPAAVLMSPQRPPYSPPGAALLRLPVIPDTKETSRQRKGPRVILSDKMQDFPVKSEFR